MYRGSSRKDRSVTGTSMAGAPSSVASQRRSSGLLSISTDTSLSSNSRDAQPSAAAVAAAAAATSAGAQLRGSDNLRDFKERVDSTIQQLSGLVSLLSSREVPSNSSNKGDANDRTAAAAAAAAPCCCRCHAEAAGFSPQPTTAAPTPPSLPPQPVASSAASKRRQARSSRDFSAAISGSSAPRRPVVGFDGCFNGDVSDGVEVASAIRRKSALSSSGSSSKHLQQQQQQQQQQQPPQQPAQHQQVQQRAGGSLAEPTAGIRFLWYDGSRKRYSARMAELICAKSVKRLHLSVHYFRVAGEDLLLLEKDCSDDGLAFLDVDSVVAFEGLSVEKVLKLQKLGCQLRPEDLSREFAVEKGRSKYYVVPVEEFGGEWRLCDAAGGSKLDSLKRVLEQQELRRGSGVKKPSA